MKKRKVLFIINPKSGKGLIRNHLLDIIDIFVKNNMRVTVHTTQGALDACRVTQKKAGKYDLVVCSGGDGTLDEVITGMMQRPESGRRPVGYIPAGSTNDFGNSLGLPRNMKEAARCIALNHPFPCDIGGFNGDYFVYIAAFGAFTEVSYQTKQDVKNVLGHLAYVLEGAKRLFNLKSYHMKIRIGEEVVEDEFIYGMVTNSQSVGGFKNITGKHVRLNDGVFEVTLIKTPKNPIELQEILGAILLREIDNKHIYYQKAERVDFESLEEIPWTLDGEFGGVHSQVEIVNYQKAISIMVKHIHQEARLPEEAHSVQTIARSLQQVRENQSLETVAEEHIVEKE